MQLLALKLATGSQKLEFTDSFIIVTPLPSRYLVLQGESKDEETKIKPVEKYYSTAL